MARSFKDALLEAGVVRKEDTPEARQEKAWRERQRRDAEELERRLADTAPLPSFEAKPTGRIVDEESADAQVTRAFCTDCGERFDPSDVEHRPHGRADQCGPCALAEGRTA